MNRKGLGLAGGRIQLMAQVMDIGLLDLPQQSP